MGNVLSWESQDAQGQPRSGFAKCIDPVGACLQPSAFTLYGANVDEAEHVNHPGHDAQDSIPDDAHIHSELVAPSTPGAMPPAKAEEF